MYTSKIKKENLTDVNNYICPYCNKKGFPSIFREACTACANQGIGKEINVSDRIKQFNNLQKDKFTMIPNCINKLKSLPFIGRIFTLFFLILLFPYISYGGNIPVTFTWDVVTGATGYKFYIGKTSGVYDPAIDIKNVLTYTVTNGLASGKYFAVVTAYDADSESEYSVELPFASIDFTTPVNGTINPSPQFWSSTSTPTYYFIPNNNYIIKDVLIDNVSKGKITSYTFSDVINPHTILVNFVKKISPPKNVNIK